MDDEEPRPPKKYPLSIAKLSKTPSWVMLGFVLGALFVIALPPLGEDKPALAPPPAAPAAPATPAPPQLLAIQAVFEDPQWEKFAVWSNDTTEVALWNGGTREFTDYFEVRRVGGAYYYRNIPSLTRPIVRTKPPLPDDCPLRFTAAVAEEIYRDWKPPPRAEPIPGSPLRPTPAAPALPKVEVTPPAAERPAVRLPTVDVSSESLPPPSKK